MSDTENNVIGLLNAIVNGSDRSYEIAGRLVTAILDSYPEADDDPRFEELLYVLACYKPSGGEYLYDEHQLAEVCGRVLGRLRAEGQ